MLTCIFLNTTILTLKYLKDIIFTGIIISRNIYIFNFMIRFRFRTHNIFLNLSINFYSLSSFSPFPPFFTMMFDFCFSSLYNTIIAHPIVFYWHESGKNWDCWNPLYHQNNNQTKRNYFTKSELRPFLSNFPINTQTKLYQIIIQRF